LLKKLDEESRVVFFQKRKALRENEELYQI